MAGLLTLVSEMKTVNVSLLNPAFVSSTGFVSPASNSTAWTPFTGLNLSDCNIAVLVVTSDGTPTLTTSSSGWVKLGQTNASSTPSFAVFYKLSPTSSEQFVLASTASEMFSAILVRVNNANNISGTGLMSAASTNANPPSHDAGSSLSHLWIAAAAWDDIITASAAPTNYTNLTTAVHTNGAGASSATAVRVLLSQTEDPAAFTSASETWVAYTLALWGTV